MGDPGVVFLPTFTRILRKDRTLDEPIELLETFYRNVSIQDPSSLSKNIADAWQSMPDDYFNFAKSEIIHCMQDPRYFLENYYTIKREDGVIQTLYPFFESQEVMHDAYLEERKTKDSAWMIVCKGRQFGGSVWAQGMIMWATIFRENCFSLLVAQKKETAESVYNMTLHALHLLPWWMRPEVLYRERGSYLEFQRKSPADRSLDPGLNSRLLVTNAGNATGVSIGQTVRAGHYTELSRWPDAGVYTADLKPSMNAPDGLYIMESTAFGRNGLFYNMWRAAINGDSSWRAVFLPVYKMRKYCTPIPKNKAFALTKEEKVFRAKIWKRERFKIPLEHFVWRRATKREFKATDGNLIGYREAYPDTWQMAFQNSGECAFSRTHLDYQEEQYCRDPKWIGEVTSDGKGDAIRPVLHLSKISPGDEKVREENHRQLRIWEKPLEEEVYVIGADVALGVEDGNMSAAVVLKVGRGGRDEQVAEWWGLCAPLHFARIIAGLGAYYNFAECAIEYAGPGYGTADYFATDLEYPNIYRYRKEDRVTGTGMTSMLHWQTNSHTREPMIGVVHESLLDDTLEIRSSFLVDEMRDFSRTSASGKFGAVEGLDDNVMALCIALSALRKSEAAETRNQRVPAAEKAKLSSASFIVYDNLKVPRYTTESERAAMDMITKNPGWALKPVERNPQNTISLAGVRHPFDLDATPWEFNRQQEEVMEF